MTNCYSIIQLFYDIGVMMCCQRWPIDILMWRMTVVLIGYYCPWPTHFLTGVKVDRIFIIYLCVIRYYSVLLVFRYWRINCSLLWLTLVTVFYLMVWYCYIMMLVIGLLLLVLYCYSHWLWRLFSIEGIPDIQYFIYSAHYYWWWYWLSDCYIPRYLFYLTVIPYWYQPFGILVAIYYYWWQWWREDDSPITVMRKVLTLFLLCVVFVPIRYDDDDQWYWLRYYSMMTVLKAKWYYWLILFVTSIIEMTYYLFIDVLWCHCVSILTLMVV